MPTELTDLEVDEVSLVDAPANKGARVVIWKADGGPPSSADEGCATMSDVDSTDLEEGDQVETTKNQLDELTKRVEAAEATAKAKDEEIAALKAKVEKAEADAAAKAATDAELAKAADKRKAFRGKLPKNLQAGYDEMKDEDKDRFMERFGKADGAGADPVAKALADQASKNEALEKRNAELTERVAKIEDAEATVAVKAELANAVNLIDLDKVAAQIVKQRKTDPEGAALYVEQLKAAGERVTAANLFGEIGRAGARTSTVEGEIDKRVSEIRKSDPKITKEQAEALVYANDPALYDRFNAERGEG